MQRHKEEKMKGTMWLLTEIYREDKNSGTLRLDLNFARKKITDKKLGDLTLREEP